MTEDEKAVYDEEDPEIPADLFSLWAKTELTDDEEIAVDEEKPAVSAEPTLDDDEMAYLTSANDAAMSAEQETIAEIADDVTEAEATAEITNDETSETTEPPLDESEMAYLTSADDSAAVSAEQEMVSELAESMAESAGIVNDDLEAETTAEIADDESSETTEPPLDESEIAYLTGANIVAEASAEQETVSESADDVAEAEATTEIADDESSETTAPPLDDDEMAYLTSADDAAASAEQEMIFGSADVVAESAEVADASSDVTDDDLDDLIDVPILPLPAESTEVTDDDLAFIRAPILSPGDPVSMPSLPVQADPAVPPAELSSPSIEEIVQEQEAIESLGNLTAPKVTDPLALFKKLRDLAEELPHNVYYAFKASRMCATLDEIIADFEA
ncbi:MAG: hypothetical protein K2J81_00175 [Treponemataceae bacterium]|nr:hypothetical protein [Treponemataceae bacterium]